MKPSILSDSISVLQERHAAGKISRRDMLRGLSLLGVSTLALGTANPLRAETKQLVLVTWGGDGTKGITAIMAEPFTAETGIAVLSDTTGGTEGAIEAQAASGNVTWDVMGIEPSAALKLGPKGILGEIDYTKISKDDFLPGEATAYSVPSLYIGFVLAYNKKFFPENPPQTWADFFDTEKFPGPRSFSKWMSGFLEAALIADGVPFAEIYPLDVDRAIAKVQTIMPDVLAVYSTGAECQQMLLDGEVAMSFAWSNRAIIAAQDNPDIVVLFEGGFLSPDVWSYMANGPAGAEVSNQFIDFATDPQRQAELFKILFASPGNVKAAALIPEELKKYDIMQPETVAKVNRLDVPWYIENYGPVLEKFHAALAL